MVGLVLPGGPEAPVFLYLLVFEFVRFDATGHLSTIIQSDTHA